MCKRLTNEEFIEKAKLVHGNKYNYSKVNYIDTKTLVIITCQKHGDFKMKPNKHLSAKQGCPSCFKENKSKCQRKSCNDFIKQCKEVYGENTYDYSTINYVNNCTNIQISCPKHGPFYKLPTVFLNRKSGCSLCKKENISKSFAEIRKKIFIEKSNILHGNKYNYSKVNYVNNKTKVIIDCPEHGEFLQTPRAHLCKGHGCPLCNESSLERNVRIILDKYKILYETQKTWEWLTYTSKQYVDFFLPDLKIIIECQGRQHFEPSEFFNKDADLSKIQDRDRNKRKLCEEHGLRVFYYSNLGIDYPYPYQVYEDLEILINEIKKD